MFDLWNSTSRMDILQNYADKKNRSGKKTDIADTMNRYKLKAAIQGL